MARANLEMTRPPAAEATTGDSAALAEIRRLTRRSFTTGAIAESADPIVAGRKLRIATADFFHCEPLERDTVLLSRLPGKSGVVVAGRRKLDSADPVEQHLAR